MADVYHTIYPTLILSRIVGLGPFSLDNDARHLSISKLGLLYSFIILLSYSGSSGYVLYEIMYAGQRQESLHISEVNKICQVACGAGVTVVTIFLAIIQRNKLLSVVNNIHQIDGEIKKLNVMIPFEKLRRISVIQIICLIIFLVALTIHAGFVGMGNTNAHGSWIVSLLPPIFNFIMEFQFVTAALLLKKHFSLLNEYLSSFSGKTKSTLDVTKELTDTYMDGNETFLGPKLVENAFIAWDGNFTRFKPKKEISALPEKQTQLVNIKIFRKIHSSLCDVKEFLNSAFSLQLLASVAQAFVLITSNLYLLFTTLSDSSSPSIAWLTYPIVWTVTHAIELILIVVTCTKTSKQANQTAVVVHKLLAKDCEPDLRNQFKLFSIQLLHRKISFSACGFFTLDMTLLQAIIGAATTYLVILIQFHNSYEKKAE